MTSSADVWPDLGTLVRHIVDTHHRYVRNAVPAITTALHRLAHQHGQATPDVRAVQQTFAQLADELLTHMEKEENILFPYIAELAAADRHTHQFPASPFGTIANPVRMMEDDHERAITLMASLRNLTRDYTPARSWTPEDAACYTALAHFDADLRAHVDLENTVLFPRALDLEDRLT